MGEGNMTGDKSKLTDFVSKEGEYVTFGDNNKGKNNGRRKYWKSV